MHANPEYVLCRQIAAYLRLQYPEILYHFDYAGLYHTKTQRGMMAAIQGRRGYPDLTILEKRNGFGGLMLEIKPEGARIYKENGSPATDHIAEQLDYLLQLTRKGYKSGFGIGFNNCKKLIDDYLNNKL